MKKIFILLSVFLSISNVYADNETVILNEASQEKICRTTLSLSEIVIKAKQNGASLSTLLSAKDKLLKNYGEDGELSATLLQFIIEDAYKLPNFDEYSLKQKQLNEFTSGQYLSCKGSFKKNNS